VSCEEPVCDVRPSPEVQLCVDFHLSPPLSLDLDGMNFRSPLPTTRIGVETSVESPELVEDAGWQAA